ncbi:DUF397 domain-containing protein [Streptomyces sp. NPDC048516]|uniref:DUF397 domain-containing protein n=1 Tax=Streptomyces sp. NPDC048516 TaxID=3365565 RepID=UPI00371BC28C
MKSTHSDPDNCVYVARPEAGSVAVKDGKAPAAGPVLVGRAAWARFTTWMTVEG